MKYTLTHSGALSAAGDLLEALAPSDAVLILHSFELGQSTEEGDAQSEAAKVTLKRVTGAPTSGSGGTTLTPRPIEAGAAAAGGTYEAMNSTALSGGTSVDLGTFGFNVLNGFQKIWTPDMRIVISPSTRLLITLDDAPADSITWQLFAEIEELGG